MILVSKALDTKLETSAADIEINDPAKAKAIRETALFYTRQRTQDLLTQMARGKKLSAMSEAELPAPVAALPAPARQAFEIIVVKHHRHAIARGLNVDLDAIARRNSRPHCR